MKVSADYRGIVSHYESCLRDHGDSCRGVDWPNPEDAAKRYRVMLDVISDRDSPCRLLDVGCGAGHLLDYVRQQPGSQPGYTGLDLSAAFVELCRGKFPDSTFHCLDILSESDAWHTLPMFDYAILNGVFTEKHSVPYEDMLEYMLTVLERVFTKVTKGIAFNVMSKHVDWERDDLFHVPYDTLASRLRRQISRHFLFRADYGLYEYTTYLYKESK